MKNQEKDDDKEQEYYYECYHDNIRYLTEKQYVEHFQKVHPNDYPFYCEVCERGFLSEEAIESHYNYSITHNNKITKKKNKNNLTCKTCGKTFKDKMAIYQHCRDKKHKK